MVLMAHNTQCTTMQTHVQGLASLHRQFAPEGAEVMLINSDLRDDRNAISASASGAGVDLPILLDPTQIIGEGLMTANAGETLVIDPSSWTLAYRGDVKGAAKAVDQLIAGEPVTVIGQQPSGANCSVDFPELARRAEHKNISYANTIAPMLNDNCVSCHRDGGIGPWAMTDYNMVRGFSLMIREVVRTQRMPPWHADPHVGTFSNDRSLSEDEIRTLVHWIEPVPRGDGPDLLAQSAKAWPVWARAGRHHRYTCRGCSRGVVDYKYKMVTNPLDEDVWAAAEIIPGDRSVLHHVITTLAN